MFDTHCHLNMPAFDDKLNEVIKEARESGVKQFLVPGTSLDNSKKAIDIVENYQNVYAAVGIHPTEDLEKLDLEETIQKFTDLVISNSRVVAIGEIGLDYFRYSAGYKTQKEFFTKLTKLAIKLDKALVVHNRHATEDIVKCLDEIGVASLAGSAVFHCCPAEKELLEYATKHKIYIGVDGDITYDQTKADFVKNVPLSLLVLETDSPYLTPFPSRLKTKYPNEPKNLIHVANFIAKIKGKKTAEIVVSATRNSLDLFGIN